MVPVGRAKGAWRYFAALGVGFCLLGSAGCAQAAEQGRPPVAEQQTKPANDAKHEDTRAQPEPGSSASRRLYVSAQCDHGCGYAEDDKGWWKKFWTDPTATFTGALALLTLVLAATSVAQSILILRSEGFTRQALKASERQAKAARKAANAAIRLELPIVRVLIPELIYVTEFPDPGMSAGGEILSVPPGTKSVVNGLNVRNDGRTRALIDAFKIGFEVAPVLTGKPSFGPVHPTGEDSTLTDSAVWFWVPMNIELSSAQIASITNQTETLWVYAAAFYRDFMGDEHESRFCWKWMRDPNSSIWTFARVKRGEVPASYVKKT